MQSKFIKFNMNNVLYNNTRTTIGIFDSDLGGLTILKQKINNVKKIELT